MKTSIVCLLVTSYLSSGDESYQPVSPPHSDSRILSTLVAVRPWLTREVRKFMSGGLPASACLEPEPVLHPKAIVINTLMTARTPSLTASRETYNHDRWSRYCCGCSRTRPSARMKVIDRLELTTNRPASLKHLADAGDSPLPPPPMQIEAQSTHGPSVYSCIIHHMRHRGMN